MRVDCTTVKANRSPNFVERNEPALHPFFKSSARDSEQLGDFVFVEVATCFVTAAIFRNSVWHFV